MKTNSRSVVTALAVGYGLLLVGCASDTKGEGASRAPELDEQYSARVHLSDAGDFHANASFSIGPRVDGARLVIRLNGSNFPTDPKSVAFGSGMPDMQVGTVLELSPAESNVLAAGNELDLTGREQGVVYGEFSSQIDRTVVSARLAVRDNATVVLTLGLEAGFRVPQDMPTLEGLGTASVMEISGHIPVTCETGLPAGPSSWSLTDDPNFTTEFCRDALEEFGLRAIREAQL